MNIFELANSKLDVIFGWLGWQGGAGAAEQPSSGKTVARSMKLKIMGKIRCCADSTKIRF